MSKAALLSTALAQVYAVLGLGMFEGEPLKGSLALLESVSVIRSDRDPKHAPPCHPGQSTDMGTLGSTAILTGPGSDYSSERSNGGMLDRLFSKKLQVARRPFLK